MLLYILNESDSWSYKIGHTKCKNANHRVKQLQTGCKKKINIIWEFEHEQANKIEKMIHRSLAWCREEGEWFLLEEIGVEDVKKLAHDCADILQTMEEIKIWKTE